ncbi:MAG TPA: HepT-like ribonuclease domain-containing protein [Bryobacteraceae bacterium]|nr:HepT-like ribonuclease domain-containing protein [Bryobacteraceae bacterium]
MLDAAREAVAFAAGRSRDDLARDRVLALALLKCIEIIGEAASKVSPETRTTYAEIPWTDIVAMRNRLTHAYFDIDLDRVCDTIANDLPPLIRILERITPASKE